jgi:hypothetical protein
VDNTCTKNINIKKKCGTNIEDVSMDRGLKIVVAENRHTVYSLLHTADQEKPRIFACHRGKRIRRDKRTKNEDLQGQQVGS